MLFLKWKITPINTIKDIETKIPLYISDSLINSLVGQENIFFAKTKQIQKYYFWFKQFKLSNEKKKFSF